MENNDKKKTLVPTIVAVVTLIALIAGATYAYFAVGTNTEGFTTQNINANAESVGSVILTKTGNGIYLNLSRVNMMKQFDNEAPKDVTYYGVDTPTGTPVTTMNKIPIGTATVTGEGNYTCTYSLTVTNANSSAANNMYTAFQNWKTNGYYENETLVSSSSDATIGQIVLNVGGTEYDFYNENIFNTKATGTLENITSENAKTIEAYMYVKNDGNKNQNAIAGTEINIEVTVDSFNCTAVEAPKPRIEYWTYEGNNVTYTGTESEYVGAATKYTEAQKSSIPNNYYIKTTLITPTVAEEDMYGAQHYYQGELVDTYGPFTLSDCEGNWKYGDPENDEEYTICVKNISAGDTLYEIQYDENGETQSFGQFTLEQCNNEISTAPAELNARCEIVKTPTHEVCAKFSSEVCIKGNYPFTPEEDIYEIQYEYNGKTLHYGQYEGLTACQADLQEGATCVKLYFKGETYTAPAWFNRDKIKQELQAAGATYCYEGTELEIGYLVCSNEPLENGKVASNALYCKVTLDDKVLCGNGKPYCDKSSDIFGCGDGEK